MFLKRFQQNHPIVTEKLIDGQEVPFQKCLLSYKSAQTYYCNVVQEFPSRIRKDCIQLLSSWVSTWNEQFPNEQTWIRNVAGVPSLIVRIDCTITNGDLYVYEIEERPAGIGMTVCMNSDFADRLCLIRKTWPEFKVIVSEKRTWEDDSLWTHLTDIDTIHTNSDLVLVRAEPGEQEFHGLTRRSVSSVSTKGNKAYGLNLNLWKKIKNQDELSFEKPFALKTLQGSKTRGVFIYTPEKLPGSETKTKMLRVYEQNKDGMYKQDYMPPMKSGLGSFEETNYPYMIYRTYFGYNLASASWECLGGLWNARKSVKVHGASDSLFGPLVPEN